jgi:hypothetical protein
MKKFFEEPELEIVLLEVEEIMLASGDYDLGDDELPPF